MEMATARRKSSLAFSTVCGNAQPADEDSQWLSWAEKQFCQIAGEDRQIDEDEFKMALGIKKSFFAERFFHLFDADGSGYISLDELMEGLYLLTKGDPVDKLRFLFSVYDVDGNGAIDHEELKVVLRACLQESAMTISEATIDSLTSALFEAADTDGSGAISFEELKEELEKNPDVMENLTISAASWLKPPSIKRTRPLLPRYLTWRYVHNNYRKILFLVVYLLINVALFIQAAYVTSRKENSNWCLVTARGCGQCLNFNSAFVLVLMLRKTITTIRTTKAAEILPTDQNIIFHKMVGIVIACLALVHTLGHIGNAWYVERNPYIDITMVELLFTNTSATSFGLAPVAGSAYITGWVLDVLLCVMVVCSMPFVRRSGHFQVFYFTHMLYVVFWTLLLMHGPRFYYWFVVPGVVFIVEKLSQTKCVKQARYGNTYVQEVNLLPSGVTHLVLTRPNRFHYKAGDYIFIQIPQIATYEWHPFTISSAPEQQGIISMHIRSVGNWTNRLYAFFEDRQKRNREETELLLGSASDIRVAMETEEAEESQYGGEFIRLKEMEFDAAEADVKPSMNHRGANGTMPHGMPRGYSVDREETEDNQHQHRTIACQTTFEMKGAKSWRSSLREEKIKVFIDGPYGTATRGIFQAEHAVLVGAGIGVTPFASILQSVMHRYRSSRQTCPACQHTWLATPPTDMMRLKKVDFIWINRNQNAFEWFVSLLTQLEMEQAQEPFDRFLELHMYMTSAMAKNDMKGIGLQMALDIMHKKGHRDLITGLKTRTQPGRPEWNKIFTQIAREKKGKVQVFFCGSPSLGKVIKKACEKFNFGFHKENF
ncbi:NADPH oxidase 5-like [Diadema setosum]|uniref:NADPH oxidase 5-like n=1 Tax=Diadema setosum TaxID=31175 RepID=UPI003B3B7B1D